MEVHVAEPAESARRILLRRVGAVQPCAHVRPVRGRSRHIRSGWERRSA